MLLLGKKINATVESAIRNPLLRNFWIKGTDFHSSIFSKELIHYRFIPNFVYKEHIFKALMSSL